MGALLDWKTIHLLLAICFVLSRSSTVTFDGGSDRTLRIVLTIDVSNSMEGDKIEETVKAIQHWIQNYLGDRNIELAVVQFASNAKLLSELSQLSSETKEHIISILPTDAQGEGLVHQGLTLAIEELKPKQTGGIIILITDIEYTEKIYNFDEIKNKIRNLDLKLFTIALGTDAIINEFDLLANGGKTFHIIDEEIMAGSIIEALKEIMLFVEDVTGASIETTLRTIVQDTTKVGTSLQEERTTEEPHNFIPTKSTENSGTDATQSNIYTHSGPSVTEKTEDLPEEKFSLGLVIGIWVAVLVFIITIIIIIFVIRSPRICKIVKNQGSYQVIKK